MPDKVLGTLLEVPLEAGVLATPKGGPQQLSTRRTTHVAPVSVVYSHHKKRLQENRGAD